MLRMINTNHQWSKVVFVHKCCHRLEWDPGRRHAPLHVVGVLICPLSHKDRLLHFLVEVRMIRNHQDDSSVHSDGYHMTKLWRDKIRKMKLRNDA